MPDFSLLSFLSRDPGAASSNRSIKPRILHRRHTRQRLGVPFRPTRMFRARAVSIRIDRAFGLIRKILLRCRPSARIGAAQLISFVIGHRANLHRGDSYVVMKRTNCNASPKALSSGSPLPLGEGWVRVFLASLLPSFLPSSLPPLDLRAHPVMLSPIKNRRQRNLPCG